MSIYKKPICWKIAYLPKSISFRNKNRSIDLCDCNNIQEFPKIPYNFLTYYIQMQYIIVPNLAINNDNNGQKTV